MHQGVAVLETRHGMSDDKETQKNPIKTSRKQGETNKNKYKYGRDAINPLKPSTTVSGIILYTIHSLFR
jgi:hypothetical protein